MQVVRRMGGECTGLEGVVLNVVGLGASIRLAAVRPLTKSTSGEGRAACTALGSDSPLLPTLAGRFISMGLARGHGRLRLRLLALLGYSEQLRDLLL